VFKKLTAGQRNSAIREYWLRSKEQGRPRFILRQMLASVLFWLILMVGLDLLGDRPHTTVQSMVVINLIMLPIFLLGGYLEGRWKWTDLQKKYPDHSLPPWE
jgi:hypothetical protein